MEELFNLVVFNSTHSAIMAEKKLISCELKVKIIPIPREISAGCGLSLKVDINEFELARKILTASNIEVEGYYYVKKVGLNKQVEKI